MLSKLPNLIIAGTNKSGTTALFRYFSSHHDVCPSTVKETCYFLPLRYNQDVEGLDKYESQFLNCIGEKVLMESTPGYFYGGKKVAAEIVKTLPNVKIVIVIRDPVSRFFSFFNFMKSMQKIRPEIMASKYLDSCLSLSPSDIQDEHNNPYFGFEGGDYNKYLRPWVDVFGSNLKIIFFENLVADPKSVLNDLANFTGIAPEPFNDIVFTQENKTRGHRNSVIQMVALKTYQHFSPVLNHHQHIKRAISRIYGFINEVPKSPASEDDVETQAVLKKLYSQSTHELHMTLTHLEDGVVLGPIPAWVSHSSSSSVNNLAGRV